MKVRVPVPGFRHAQAIIMRSMLQYLQANPGAGEMVNGQYKECPIAPQHTPMLRDMFKAAYPEYAGYVSQHPFSDPVMKALWMEACQISQNVNDPNIHMAQPKISTNPKLVKAVNTLQASHSAVLNHQGSNQPLNNALGQLAGHQPSIEEEIEKLRQANEELQRAVPPHLLKDPRVLTMPLISVGHNKDGEPTSIFLGENGVDGSISKGPLGYKIELTVPETEELGKHRMWDCSRPDGTIDTISFVAQVDSTGNMYWAIYKIQIGKSPFTEKYTHTIEGPVGLRQFLAEPNGIILQGLGEQNSRIDFDHLKKFPVVEKQIDLNNPLAELGGDSPVPGHAGRNIQQQNNNPVPPPIIVPVSQNAQPSMPRGPITTPVPLQGNPALHEAASALADSNVVHRGSHVPDNGVGILAPGEDQARSRAQTR